MDENRASRRQRVLKSGKIIYNNGSIVIDCIIRNITDTGAQLKVPTSVGIPDHFEFSETMAGKRRPVVVVWRKGDLIGIRFDETTPAQQRAR
jgi:PilZ domain-containing protein